MWLPGKGLAASQSPGDTETSAYPELETPLHIQVPFSLRHLSHSWGTGYVRVRLDAEGVVEDWVPIQLPHIELVEAVGRSLQTARFLPGMENGEPIRTEVTLRIPFNEIGTYGVLMETVTEHIESRQAAINPRKDELALSAPELLDKPIKLLKTGPVYQVRDETGTYLKGTVEVTFYVDHLGKPRLIRASPDSPEVLREAAILSVQSFQFTKPVRNGRPVVVKARLPVVIGGEE